MAHPGKGLLAAVMVVGTIWIPATSQAAQPVEILTERTETTRVFANPNGTRTMEAYAVPVRTKRDGNWVPIDTRLQRQPDGSIAPAAIPVGLRLSGGGSGPMATIDQDGAAVSLSWPSPLPAPILDGDSATYPEVLPGVDLKLRANSTGFAQLLVVKNAAAARNPALRRIKFATSTKGLNLRVDKDGTTTAVDHSGRPVFTSGSPTMWDSAPHHQTLRLERTPGELAVVPDHAMLSDAGTRYPVYIDPSYSTVQYRWTMVNSSKKDTSYWTDDFYRDDVRVGETYSTGEGPWRSLFQMGIARLHRAAISRAWFSISMTHTANCAATSVELWHTKNIDPAVALTWNNSSGHWLDGSALDTRSGKANKSSCNQPAMLMEFETARVKSTVQAAVDANQDAVAFGLRIPSAHEGDQLYWKRFDETTARLNVEFNAAPLAPTGVTTVPGTACGTAGAPTPLDTATPTFTGAGYDLDGDNVSNSLEVLSGETVIHTAPTGTVGSGTAVSWPAIPAGILPDSNPSAVFSYRARTKDAGLDGAYGARCYFTVDTFRPSPATLSSTDFPDGSPGKFAGEIGTFTFTKSTSDTDISGFRYGFSSSATNMWAPIGSDGTARVPITLWSGDASDVFKTLYVRSVDRAGNQSPLNAGWNLWARGRTVTTPAVRDDFNGDRRADVSAVVDQGFGRTSVWNFVTGGAGYLAWDTGFGGGFPLDRIQSVSGDFDGDKRTDIAVFREDPGPIVRLFLLRSDGSRYEVASEAAWSGTGYRTSHMRLAAGDFDADGDDDIAVFQGLATKQTKLLLFTSNAGQFGNPVQQWDSGAGNQALAALTPVAGDFDGDGDDDVAALIETGANQSKLNLHVANGGVLAAPTTPWTSTSFAAARARLAVGNVDGTQGDDEIVALYNDGGTNARLIVLSGNAGAWSNTTWWTSTAFDAAKASPAVGDFNLDGKADAAAVQEIGGGVKRLSTFTSSGSAFAGPATSWEGLVGAAAPGATIISGRVYRMMAVHSGQCVEVPGNSTVNGTQIDQWGCVHTAGWQSFTVERIGSSPSFVIRTSGGKCIDLRGWSIVDNGQLVQWSCAATPQANQQFSFDYVSGSGLDLVVQIRNVHSERCLNVASAGLAEGADVLQIACSGAPPTHRQFTMRLDP